METYSTFQYTVITSYSIHYTKLYDNGTPVNFEIISGDSYLVPLENVTLSVNASSPGRISVVSEYGNQYYYNLN